MFQFFSLAQFTLPLFFLREELCKKSIITDRAELKSYNPKTQDLPFTDWPFHSFPKDIINMQLALTRRS
jgi:hypothetical protein